MLQKEHHNTQETYNCIFGSFGLFLDNKANVQVKNSSSCFPLEITLNKWEYIENIKLKYYPYHALGSSYFRIVYENLVSEILHKIMSKTE